jgi:hypothetical protein
MRLNIPLAVLAILVIGSGALFANPIVIFSPITLNPGNALVVTFTTNPAAWGSATPDFLDLSLAADGYFSSPTSRDNIVASLYAGDTFLGDWSYSGSLPVSQFIGWDLGGNWKSPTSLAPQPWTVVDFTSLLSGEVQGSIVLKIQSGSVTFDASKYGPSLYLMRTVSPDGAAYGMNTWLTIENARVVPEPSTLTLLGIGVISLIGYGWRRMA